MAGLFRGLSTRPCCPRSLQRVWKCAHGRTLRAGPFGQRVVLRPGGALPSGISLAAAHNLLYLRSVLLAARAPLEVACVGASPRLRRYPVQKRDLAADGCSDRQEGF